MWLRGIVANKLLELHRHHLGTLKRDAGCEVGLYDDAAPDTTSAALVAHLTGYATGPATAAGGAEIKVSLHDEFRERLWHGK